MTEYDAVMEIGKAAAQVGFGLVVVAFLIALVGAFR
jgi:hypothetical protein